LNIGGEGHGSGSSRVPIGTGVINSGKLMRDSVTQCIFASKIARAQGDVNMGALSVFFAGKNYTNPVN